MNQLHDHLDCPKSKQLGGDFAQIAKFVVATDSRRARVLFSEAVGDNNLPNCALVSDND
jgi:hypothetical protein